MHRRVTVVAEVGVAHQGREGFGLGFLDAAEHGLAVVLAHRGEAVGAGGFGDGVECAAEERVEIWRRGGHGEDVVERDRAGAREVAARWNQRVEDRDQQFARSAVERHARLRIMPSAM